MSKVQMRALVEQRLSAAAEEIFGLFERTIAEYEEELCRSKEENERQQKLLDAVFKPQLRLHRADVQELLVSKEEVPPEQQDWSPHLDQEDPEPPHIKEEQEEVWTSQEGERLQGLDETYINKFSFTPVSVRSEDDEEKPQSSQLHQRHTEQMETEADGEDCGGPEPARNFNSDIHSQPDSDEKSEDSSEPETEDRDDWEETRQPQSDVQELLVSKEEVPPEQQDWSPNLDQEDPEPLHIKEEQEEVWTSQEGEHLQGLDEADITKFSFTPVPVKSEDDEEKPQSSQLHQRHTEQMEIEPDVEDWGGPEPDTDYKSEDSSEPVTEDDDDWDKTREPQSGLNSLRNYEVPVSDEKSGAGEKPFICSECGKGFCNKSNMRKHIRLHTKETPFSCPYCNKRFTRCDTLKDHIRMHTGEKPFSCSVCGKSFTHKANLTSHMRTHTGEKPFCCPFCEKRFSYRKILKDHIRTHTGEKPFSCSVCGKSFTHKTTLITHKKTHTGERPFSCSDCGKSFIQKADMLSHRWTHTGEKPFSCSVCGKSFTLKATLQRHMRTHTGEKPFSCSVCGKSFTRNDCLQTHLREHMRTQSAEIHAVVQ